MLFNLVEAMLNYYIRTKYLKEVKKTKVKIEVGIWDNCLLNFKINQIQEILMIQMSSMPCERKISH